MKNFMNILGNRYNSVRTKDCDNDTFESLAVNRRNLTRQFSIVDSFFHQRKEGERTRYPKGKHATALKHMLCLPWQFQRFIECGILFLFRSHFSYLFISLSVSSMILGCSKKVQKLKIYSWNIKEIWQACKVIRVKCKTWIANIVAIAKGYRNLE